MELLKDFLDKDMIEQITILDQIKEARQIEIIPALMDIYSQQQMDEAVRHMVYHTLYTILAGQSQSIIAGLASGSHRLIILCARRAGADKIVEARSPLLDYVKKTDDPELLSEVIRSLGNYRDPALVDIFLPFLEHRDVTVAGVAIDALVSIADPRASQALLALVSGQEEKIAAAGECGLTLAMAVKSLAKFADRETIGFLNKRIHHPNPVFRRVVMSTLHEIGAAALSSLAACLENGDRDEKIMAANVIGMIADKKGADILVSLLDQHPDLEPNLKFAAYEALGRISSMRSVVGLTDGLAEHEELALIAVVDGLNRLCNPGVVKALTEKINSDAFQAKHIIQAIITAKSRKLFVELYKSPDSAALLMDELVRSKNKEAVEEFRNILEKMGDARAVAGLKQLANGAEISPVKHIVAVDDSKAMLFFYKNVAAELNMNLVTFSNGEEVVDYFRIASSVDLLITDMNMPGMSGVELVQELAKSGLLRNLPVLMATTESEVSQKELAEQAGVRLFISKPFSKEEFKKKIDQLLT